MRAHAAVLQLNWLVGGLPTQACMVASDHTAGRRSDTPLNKECVSDVVEQDGARLGVNRGTAERSGLLPRASWATRGKLQRPREGVERRQNVARGMGRSMHASSTSRHRGARTQHHEKRPCAQAEPQRALLGEARARTRHAGAVVPHTSWCDVASLACSRPRYL